MKNYMYFHSRSWHCSEYDIQQKYHECNYSDLNKLPSYKGT